MRDTAFPRRHRLPSTEGLTNEDGFPAQEGDLLVARSKEGALNKIISSLHGFFTHSAIVTKVEGGFPTEVSHAYGIGLITQDFQKFAESYETIAVARFSNDKLKELQIEDLAEAATQAQELSQKRKDLTVAQRLDIKRLSNNASKESAPQTETPGEGYGFSGYDLGLAGVISARARVRELGWLTFDGNRKWVEDYDFVLSEGDHRFVKDPRKLRSRVTKRFTCAGYVLNVYRKKYGSDVIEPAFLEHVYRVGDWVFDPNTQKMTYQGPSTFSIDQTNTGIADVNLLNAGGFQGWDERGWTFDDSNEHHKTLFDDFVRSHEELGIDRDLIDKALTRLETTSVSLGTLYGANQLKGRTAFTVDTVVGPCDLWEAPAFSPPQPSPDQPEEETRGFIYGANHYFKYAEDSATWLKKLRRLVGWAWP